MSPLPCVCMQSESRCEVSTANRICSEEFPRSTAIYVLIRDSVRQVSTITRLIPSIAKLCLRPRGCMGQRVMGRPANLGKVPRFPANQRSLSPRALFTLMSPVTPLTPFIGDSLWKIPNVTVGSNLVVCLKCLAAWNKYSKSCSRCHFRILQPHIAKPTSLFSTVHNYII